MMFYRILLFFICVWSAVIAASAEEAEVIRVGIYENRPKVFSLPEGDAAGVFPDVLKHIADLEGWKLEFVKGSWSECLDRLEKGEIDVMTDMAPSEERQEKFDFCSEDVFINWGAVYLSKHCDAESIPDLEGKTIAALKGCIHTESKHGIKSLLKNFGIKSKIIDVDSYEEVFRLLDEGEVDAGVVNRLFGQMQQKNYDIVPTSIVFNPRHLTFAFTKNTEKSANLIRQIDRRLKFMKENKDSFLYRAIDGYILGMPPEFVRKGSDTGRAIPLNKREKEWIRNHEDIRLGIDPSFAPYEYFDENGAYGGIASGYVGILKNRVGLDLKVIPNLSWKEAVAKAINGEIDVLPCVGRTMERKKHFLYSHPYVIFQRVVVVRSDTPFISDISEISDWKIGVQASSSHEGYVKENTNIDPVVYADFPKSINALSKGEVDAVVANLACASFWIRKLNLTNLKVAFAIPGENEKLYFAVRKDWPELVGIINKGLASIDEAEAEEIRRRWVFVKYERGLNPKEVALWIIGIILVAALITSIMVFWNRRLKREIRRRKEAEDSRDSLFHMIVHDLNNPLVGILGANELLMAECEKSVRDEEKVHGFLDLINSSSNDMAALIKSILDVSKLESGNMQVDMQDINAVEILGKVVEQFGPLAEKRNMKIELDIDAVGTNMFADKDLITRAIQNLVTNSLRYAGKGNTLTCFFRKEAGYDIIGVRDNGPGIPVALHDRIFSKFFRASSSREERTYATGLGLTFCKMAAEAQGGTIELHSGLGKGSSFEVRLKAKS